MCVCVCVCVCGRRVQIEASRMSKMSLNKFLVPPCVDLKIKEQTLVQKLPTIAVGK